MRTYRKLTLAFALLAVAPPSSRAGAAEPGPPGAAWSKNVPMTDGATHYYAATDGASGNPGTREAPWDLPSALNGSHKMAPGDVIWVRGGTYKGKFEVKLAGKKDAPVIVRAYPGERATVLDNHVTVAEPASNVWLWGLEIAGSVPVEKRETKQTGSWPSDLPPSGGLDIYSGDHHKMIDLVIHDNTTGAVGWWAPSDGGEIHGCLIFRNGWRAPDRSHGHCIYTQNKDDLKTISNCILSVDPRAGSHSVHAYGSSKAYVDNFLIEDNIVYGSGTFLVGGGRPSHNIKVVSNFLYKVPMRIGYGAQNEDCEVRDNVLGGGRLVIEKYRTAVEEGNVREIPARRAVLIPDKYDPNRAHVAVYNGAKVTEVPVDVSKFLKPGDGFRLMDPEDVFGKPVSQGTSQGGTLPVPVKGEFAAYVVLKGEPR